MVVGGPLAFHIPQEMLEFGADIVVKGEVEEGVQALVEALKCGRSGIVIEMAPGPDLKHCVSPRYDLLDFDIYESMAIQSSRGCPFHCEFCDITLMFGRSVRTKTPQQVLERTRYSLRPRLEKRCFVCRRQLHRAAAQRKSTAETTDSMDGRTRPSIRVRHPSICEPCRRCRK